jgi:diguanylate cyclase (GGDEF)-like protein/putative nucleotidyltransferase with HDIG domain
MAPPKHYATLSTASRVYIGVVVCAGGLTVLQSFYGLVYQNPGWRWIVLAVLTLLSGSATLRLPSLPATISVSETFIFTSVLLFGASAGTLTVALDALVISFWSYRRGDPLFKIVFNLFALPLAIWLAAHLFFALPEVRPLWQQPLPLFGNPTLDVSEILLPLALLASVYFLLNSGVITIAIALDKRVRPLAIWREHFALLSLNYFGGASVAALLVNYSRDVNFKQLVLMVPLLVVTYLTFRWQIGRLVLAHRHLTALNNLYMSTIETLAMAIDAKDQITHGHIRRVQLYAVGLAKRVGIEDQSLIKAIEAAALLHDMGKLAVPEYILNKPGPLTPAEFAKMKVHASVGADILSAIDFPYPVVPIVRHHHENWDGSGYPDGLVGTNIPIGARILSVVDCFDALTSDRPYRPRLPDREALRILVERRGSMYDASIVDTFLEVHADIAPRITSSVAAVPLRAISDAAIPTVTSRLESAPLEEISASAEEMLTLFDLAHILKSHMSLSDAGDVIAKHLRRLVPSSLTVFFLYDIDTDEIVAAHATGDQAALVTGLRIGVGQRLSGWVAAHRQVIRNSDPVLDLGETVRAMTPRPRSCLSIPLLAQRELVGVLSLYSTVHEAFSEDHQRIVEVVSHQVSAIVKNAADFEATKRQALRDQLTGLPNIEHLRQLTSSATSNDLLGDAFSLVVVDVDKLAQINEHYGHSAGDRILGRLVRAIRRSLRAADFLFRYRDDEFVVVLFHTDYPTCLGVVRRIKESLRRDVAAHDAETFAVTIAVAVAPIDGQSIDELITVATRRLIRDPRPGGPDEPNSEAIH